MTLGRDGKKKACLRHPRVVIFDNSVYAVIDLSFRRNSKIHVMKFDQFDLALSYYVSFSAKFFVDVNVVKAILSRAFHSCSSKSVFSVLLVCSVLVF